MSTMTVKPGVITRRFTAVDGQTYVETPSRIYAVDAQNKVLYSIDLDEWSNYESFLYEQAYCCVVCDGLHGKFGCYSGADPNA